MRNPFHGSHVALPTPFDGEDVDLDAFREMIDYHAQAATDGVVVAGTTGEGATLSASERRELFELAVERAAGRLPVMAGVGTNDTRQTLELARAAEAAGVDGLLVVTPYYNKPSRLGLLRHYGAVVEATSLPVVLYNVPSRTGSDLAPEVTAEIAERFPSVVAIKEASPAPDRPRELAEATSLEVLSGEDTRIAEYMRAGAVGAVNVVGNLVPDEVAELCRAASPGGDEARADELTLYLAPLVRDLFIEVNPVPVKTALARLGRCRSDVRSPLAPLEGAHEGQLERTLRRAGILSAVASSR